MVWSPSDLVGDGLIFLEKVYTEQVGPIAAQRLVGAFRGSTLANYEGCW